MRSSNFFKMLSQTEIETALSQLPEVEGELAKKVRAAMKSVFKENLDLLKPDELKKVIDFMIAPGKQFGVDNYMTTEQAKKILNRMSLHS